MKLPLLTLALLAGATMASAQTSLVKDVQNTMKSVKDYPAYQKAVATLTPAFTNPESAGDALTFFVPGKTGFDVYDNYLVQTSLGQQVNPEDMGNALLDGYGYFLQALPLDSLPDAKGKVKPKYSKEIVSKIAGHVNDFDQVAVGFWTAQKFDKAYDAWEACLDITSNPRYAKSGIRPYPDSIVSEIRYNQGLAAWQAGNLDKAVEAFNRSIDLGNNKIAAYEYAYSVAYLNKDKENMRRFARLGLDRFGTADPRFLQWTVNGYIEDGKYDEARAMLADAIAKDPTHAAPYYLSSGVLNETLKDRDAAKNDYRQAIALDDKMAQAYMNLGRMLAEDYDSLDQETGSMSQADYNKYAFEVLNPLLRESAQNFETAYQINEELRDCLQYLKNIYYRLNDTANYKRVEDLLRY